MRSPPLGMPQGHSGVAFKSKMALFAPRNWVSMLILSSDTREMVGLWILYGAIIRGARKGRRSPALAPDAYDVERFWFLAVDGIFTPRRLPFEILSEYDLKRLIIPHFAPRPPSEFPARANCAARAMCRLFFAIAGYQSGGSYNFGCY